MKKGYLVNKSSPDWKLLVGSTDTYWVIAKKNNPAQTNLEGRGSSLQVNNTFIVPKPRHDNLKLLPKRHPFSHPAAAVVARGPTVSGVLQQTSSEKFRQIPSAWIALPIF